VVLRILVFIQKVELLAYSFVGRLDCFVPSSHLQPNNSSSDFLKYRNADVDTMDRVAAMLMLLGLLVVSITLQTDMTWS
jgi:hypothetical protein